MWRFAGKSQAFEDLTLWELAANNKNGNKFYSQRVTAAMGRHHDFGRKKECSGSLSCLAQRSSIPFLSVTLLAVGKTKNLLDWQQASLTSFSLLGLDQDTC